MQKVPALVTCLTVCGFLWSANRAGCQTAEFRGVWVDAWHPGFKTSNDVQQLVADVRKANCNAIIAQVRRRGDAFYNDSPYDPKTADTNVTPGDFDSLAELLRQGHDTKAGPRLEIHAWLTAYPVATTAKPTDPEHVFNAHPEWLSQTYTGAKFDGVEKGYWLDPGHREVQDHLLYIVMDIVSRYDVDGVCFDYLRYPSQDWGYNSNAVSRFNAHYRRSGIPSRTDPDWLQFRREQITALLRKIYLSVITVKPRVKISVAGIAFAPGIATEAEWTNSTPYQRCLQDWRAWMEEGIVDFAIPLIFYSQHRERHAVDFAQWSAFAKNHRYGRHIVIGTGNYMNQLTNSLLQMRIAREPTASGNRADGLALYSYDRPAQGVSRAAALTALVRANGADSDTEPLFARPAVMPEMPWKTRPTTGHLKGWVFDDNRSHVLDGATVTIVGPVNRTLTTDAAGFFGAVDLPPGNYNLTASATGFVTRTNSVEVTTGKVVTEDFELNGSPR